MNHDCISANCGSKNMLIMGGPSTFICLILILATKSATLDPNSLLAVKQRKKLFDDVVSVVSYLSRILG